jgi:hypothetical protein
MEALVHLQVDKYKGGKPMQSISTWVRLVWRALFLRTDAYEEMRQAESPFGKGLVIILVVGVIVALAGLVGSVLEWAATPDLTAIQDTVYKGLIAMPWYQEMMVRTPDFPAEFERWYNWGWTLARWMGASSLSSAAGNLVLTPLGLAARWLVYGLLAHLFARMLRGQAGLGQTLGCTALAVAPQLLNLAQVLPFLGVGGVVGTWTLLCRYVALKQAHRLSWGRALAATLLPTLALVLLGLILAGILAAGLATLAPQLSF